MHSAPSHPQFRHSLSRAMGGRPGRDRRWRCRRALLRLPANTWQLRLSSPGMKCSEAAHEWPGVGMVSGPGGLRTCWVWGSGRLAPGGLGAGGGWVSGQLRGAWWHSEQPLLRAPSTCCSAGKERSGGDKRTEEQRLPHQPRVRAVRPFARTCPEDPLPSGGPAARAVLTGCPTWGGSMLLAATNC